MRPDCPPPGYHLVSDLSWWHVAFPLVVFAVMFVVLVARQVREQRRVAFHSEALDAASRSPRRGCWLSRFFTIEYRQVQPPHAMRSWRRSAALQGAARTGLTPGAA